MYPFTRSGTGTSCRALGWLIALAPCAALYDHHPRTMTRNLSNRPIPERGSRLALRSRSQWFWFAGYDRACRYRQHHQWAGLRIGVQACHLPQMYRASRRRSGPDGYGDGCQLYRWRWRPPSDWIIPTGNPGLRNGPVDLPAARHCNISTSLLRQAHPF